MINAKEEFLEAIKDMPKVKCAHIHNEDYDDYDKKIILNSIILPINYTKQEYNEFLKKLDFEYDNGYGIQELFGTIWLEDGTWISRGEYDGSEWWKYNKLPEIPEILKDKIQ